MKLHLAMVKRQTTPCCIRPGLSDKACQTVELVDQSTQTPEAWLGDCGVVLVTELRKLIEAEKGFPVSPKVIDMSSDKPRLPPPPPPPPSPQITKGAKPSLSSGLAFLAELKRVQDARKPPDEDTYIIQ